MDFMLQKHGAKHIYKVPEGLRELCTDISREVLRSQPRNIYDFIAEYVDTLLITRENTKVAVGLVNNILLGSQAILNILYRTGLNLEQIALAAPRIQNAFREYLDAIDMQPIQICEDRTCDEKSKVSIRSILEATGATEEDAERAATIIQAAFRGHYERMALNEARGKVQWQKAVMNTLAILKKAGATQAEMTKSARLIKYAYRGYYTRRNQKIDFSDTEEEMERKDKRIVEPMETIQAVAWMEMMYEDSGLTLERANEAALIIQKAYRRYRVRRGCYDVQRIESTKSMVVAAILENLHQRVFERVMSREDIPEEYGTREDMMSASVKLQLAFKDHLRHTRIIQEGHLESGWDTEEEYEELNEKESDVMEVTEYDEKINDLTSASEDKVKEKEEEEEAIKEKSMIDDTELSESQATTMNIMETQPVQEQPENVPVHLEESEGRTAIKILMKNRIIGVESTVGIPHESINAEAPATEGQEEGMIHEHKEDTQ